MERKRITKSLGKTQMYQALHERIIIKKSYQNMHIVRLETLLKIQTSFGKRYGLLECLSLWSDRFE